LESNQKPYGKQTEKVPITHPLPKETATTTTMYTIFNKLPILFVTSSSALIALSSTAAAAATSSLVSSGENNLRHRFLQSSSAFPEYSQQCRDDAGPPFGDDSETFGDNKKYHDGTPATPVDGNDACPKPLKGACKTKPKKEAYLEGPLQCNGKGWFCRILEEPGWPTVALLTDTNFGYCNTTEGYEDKGYDGAGHCHGSDDDATFYWWVRDHWFRGYNGRLRCCCGWNNVVKKGKIVNRCDHRRLVTKDENLDNCRDANEEGSKPYNGGCKASPTIGEPIDEDALIGDSMCWEMSKFGAPEDGDDENDGSGDDEDEEEEEDEEDDENDGSGNSEDEDDEDEEDEDDENDGSGDSEDEGDEDEEDEDDENDGSGDSEDEEEEESEDEEEEEEEEVCVNVKKFIWKVRKGKTIQKKCAKWVTKKLKKNKNFCNKKTSEGIKIGVHCPVVCGSC